MDVIRFKHKKRWQLVAIFLLSPLIIQISQAVATTAGPGLPGVLVISNGDPRFQETFLMDLCAWLEGRFLVEVSCQFSAGEGQALELSAFSYVIYYGLDASTPPGGTLIDQLGSWLNGSPQRRLAWLNYHGEKFDFSPWGFTVSGRDLEDGAGKLLYFGRRAVEFELPHAVVKPALWLNRQAEISALAPRREAEPLPVMLNGTAVNGSEVMYVGYAPTAYLTPLGAQLPFMDVMHRFFGVTAASHKNAFLRLEDVSCRTPRDKLLAAASLLRSGSVPFTAAVIPVFREGSTFICSISHDRAFRRVLLQALGLGNRNSLVLHGWSHQYKGVTAEDSEFLDSTTGRFLTVPEVRERVANALAEMRRSGLLVNSRVVAWETPHYAQSPEVCEQVLEVVFKVIFQDPCWNSTLAFLPYAMRHNGVVWLPTFLGFISEPAAESVARIKLYAEKLAGLKYNVEVGLFIHPAIVEPAVIGEVVGYLQSLGWQFNALSDRWVWPTVR